MGFEGGEDEQADSVGGADVGGDGGAVGVDGGRVGAAGGVAEHVVLEDGVEGEAVGVAELVFRNTIRFIT